MENANKENKIPIKTTKENIKPIYLTKRILTQKECADYCNGKVEWSSFPDADHYQTEIDKMTIELEELKQAGKKLGQINDITNKENEELKQVKLKLEQAEKRLAQSENKLEQLRKVIKNDTN